jgi:hypothetical protein
LALFLSEGQRKPKETGGNTGKRMKQRTFTFLQTMPAPSDAAWSVVGACKGYGYAARVALEGKPGGKWSHRWLARQLRVSTGFLSRVLNDRQDMPEWMHKPIAVLTGSNLILQYAAEQDGKRGATEHETIKRLAAMLRAAWKSTYKTIPASDVDHHAGWRLGRLLAYDKDTTSAQTMGRHMIQRVKDWLRERRLLRLRRQMKVYAFNRYILATIVHEWNRERLARSPQQVARMDAADRKRLARLQR